MHGLCNVEVYSVNCVDDSSKALDVNLSCVVSRNTEIVVNKSLEILETEVTFDVLVELIFFFLVCGRSILFNLFKASIKEYICLLCKDSLDFSFSFSVNFRKKFVYSVFGKSLASEISFVDFN